MLKARFAEALGLLDVEGAWEMDNQPVADFGNVNLAGAGTVRTGFAVFPLLNPMHLIKSPDNRPFETPGGTLAATTGSRQVGTGRQPIAAVYGAYLVRVTAAGAVYLPVTTTINIRVFSAAAASGNALTTIGTFNASAGANFYESIPIVAPAERAISQEGLAPSTAACAIFDGDSIFCELVAAAALNVLGNLLYVVLMMY